MKKYIPVLLFIIFFSGFISFQIAYDMFDTTASTPKEGRLLKEHYSSLYKETLFHTIDGSRIELTKLKSKTVIIHFWASWCVPCHKEIDILSKAYNDSIRDDLEIISVNTDGENAERLIKKIKKRYDIRFPIVYDFDSSICLDFSVDRLPFLIVYKNGKFVKRVQGLNDKELMDLIESI